MALLLLMVVVVVEPEVVVVVVARLVHGWVVVVHGRLLVLRCCWGVVNAAYSGTLCDRQYSNDTW